MEQKRKYKNTADKQTTWFVFFFALIALTASLVLAFIVGNYDGTKFVPTFFISLLPLTILFIIFALYITSSKVKAKRGNKKLTLVLDDFSNKYKLLKDVKIDKDHKFDYVLLTPYELYGVTIKSYEGNISGLDSDQTWRQSLAFKKKKNAIPNPIKENLELGELFKKKSGISLTPVVVLVSGNRGYIISEYLYSPNQLVDLVGTSREVKYQKNDIDDIVSKLQ